MHLDAALFREGDKPLTITAVQRSWVMHVAPRDSDMQGRAPSLAALQGLQVVSIWANPRRVSRLAALEMNLHWRKGAYTHQSGYQCGIIPVSACGCATSAKIVLRHIMSPRNFSLVLSKISPRQHNLSEISVYSLLDESRQTKNQLNCKNDYIEDQGPQVVNSINSYMLPIQLLSVENFHNHQKARSLAFLPLFETWGCVSTIKFGIGRENFCGHWKSLSLLINY